MYAKLFSRIAQSSLMEEKVTTRYVFMMMLALSDRNGDVIGTDVAIARMMNVSVDEFKSATDPLLSPDPDSNSQAEDGRRLVPSDNGRGYKIVNYLCYRDMKSEEEKREYMRNYMRERRSKGTVKSVKSGKSELSDVTHTEAEADTDSKADTTKGKGKELSPEAIEFSEWFKSTLPDQDQKTMENNWLANFCEAYEKLTRIDGYPPTEIRAVCKWAREDQFWSQNFKSPSKLRKRDSNKTLYWNVFSQRMKQSNQSTQKPKFSDSYNEHEKLLSDMP
jgi:hypothetical protein